MHLYAFLFVCLCHGIHSPEPHRASGFKYDPHCLQRHVVGHHPPTHTLLDDFSKTTFLTTFSRRLFQCVWHHVYGGNAPRGVLHRVQGSMRDWRVRPFYFSTPSLCSIVLPITFFGAIWLGRRTYMCRGIPAKEPHVYAHAPLPPRTAKPRWDRCCSRPRTARDEKGDHGATMVGPILMHFLCMLNAFVCIS